jgi:hypothetical protein
MFAMTVLVVMFLWSSPSVGLVWCDGHDGLTMAQQDEQPPPGSDADQGPKHRPRETPASGEGRGERRWDKSRHDRWHGLRDGGELSPEMIDSAMGVLQDKLPHYYKEMARLREADKAKFERAIRAIMPVVLEYLEMRDRDQKLADSIIEEFKIEHQLRELSKEFRAAEGSPEKQAACEGEIRKLVRQQLELRQVWQEARLKEFAERLERQQQDLAQERKNLEQRRAKQDELVAQRVEEVKSGKLGERFGPRGPRRGGRGEAGDSPRDVRGQGPRPPQPDARPLPDRPHGDPDAPPPPAGDRDAGARPPQPDEPAPAESEEEPED